MTSLANKHTSSHHKFKWQWDLETLDLLGDGVPWTVPQFFSFWHYSAAEFLGPDLHTYFLQTGPPVPPFLPPAGNDGSIIVVGSGAPVWHADGLYCLTKIHPTVQFQNCWKKYFNFKL